MKEARPLYSVSTAKRDKEMNKTTIGSFVRGKLCEPSRLDPFGGMCYHSLKMRGTSMKNLKVTLVAACAVVVGCGFTASAAYVPVEWIKANGKQWIYTEYVPKCTDKVEIKIKTDTVGTTHGLWCSRGTTTSTATFTGFLSSTKKFRLFCKIGHGYSGVRHGVAA